MHCFKTQMGTGMFKRIINQFSFVEKAEEKLLAALIRPQGLQPGWLSSRWNACPVLKRNQSGKVFKEFSGTTCTLMVKEVPFLNGNLSIYSCFIDVLYDLRRILALTFDVFGSFYLREMIHDPVSITRIAFKDKIMGFRIKF